MGQVSGVDWGSAPEWFAAIGTVVAAGGAILLLHRESEQIREIRGEAQRRPASLVASWLEESGETAEAGRLVARLNIRNGSEEPVYDVAIAYKKADSQTIQLKSLDILPPNFTSVSDQLVWGFQDTSSGSLVFALPPLVTTFTDSRGERWERTYEGHLANLAG